MDPPATAQRQHLRAAGNRSEQALASAPRPNAERYGKSRTVTG